MSIEIIRRSDFSELRSCGEYGVNSSRSTWIKSMVENRCLEENVEGCQKNITQMLGRDYDRCFHSIAFGSVLMFFHLRRLLGMADM